MTDRPVLGVVGPGRVGWALARAARRAGYRVATVAGGSAPARERLATAVEAHAIGDPSEVGGDLVLLAVRDAALAALGPAIRARTAARLVHTAGALPAAALGVRDAGTFHPLRSFAGEPRDVELAGCGVAIEADGDELLRDLRRLADHLGMFVIEVAPAGRVRYHAAAVLAGNAPIALLTLAHRQLTELGVDAALAESVLLRLLASVVENARERGIGAALSGPVLRGDAETVRRHIDALAATDETAAAVYAAVGRATLEVAELVAGGPDTAAVEAIRAALRERQPG